MGTLYAGTLVRRLVHVLSMMMPRLLTIVAIRVEMISMRGGDYTTRTSGGATTSGVHGGSCIASGSSPTGSGEQWVSSGEQS